MDTFTMMKLVIWCSAFGPPTTWVGIFGAQFKYRVICKAEKALNVMHRLSIANSACTSGTAEQIMRDDNSTGNAILNERRRLLCEEIVVLPAIK